MASTSHPGPQQTERGTLDLPTHPAVLDMLTWDHKKLLMWVEQRSPTLLQNKDRTRFQAENITGTAFLAMTRDDYKQCRISTTAAAGLGFLADEVKHGKLLGQTAGGKRKVDETNAPRPQKRPRRKQQSRKDGNDRTDDGLSSSPKGIDINQFRDEDDDGLDFDAEQLVKLESTYPKEMLAIAKRAREVKRRIKQLLEDLGEGTRDPWKTVVSRLSNPAEITELMFPFTGTSIPERFDVRGPSGNWAFIGREKFKPIVTKVDELSKTRSKTSLWLYGTSGYGKSHILAALVCYLSARGEKVLYLPDCRKFSQLGIVKYMKHALLFTWTNKKAQEKIFSLSTEDEIQTFLEDNQPLFAIDQTNGFVPTGKADSARMEYAQSWLDTTIGDSKAIYSTSANYEDYHRLQKKQNYSNTFYLYGGLSPNEMKEWWNRHKSIKATEKEKKNTEFYTGRIPLFLEYCIRDGKINFDRPELWKVSQKAQSFAFRLYAKADTREGHSNWERYCNYVIACIAGSEVPNMEDCDDLIDHRYFYAVDKVGHFTCGMAVYAVTDAINSLKGTPCIAHQVLKLMQNFKDNPSVAGFIIELAVLESISRCGLNIPDHRNIMQKMKMVHFEGLPKFDTEEHPVLYVPQQYNYRDIDGIIVDVNEKEKKLYLYPIQITISKSHKDSYKKFLEHYPEWAKELKKYNVKVTFVWIKPEKTTPAVQETNPDAGKCVIHLSDIDGDVWKEYTRFKGLDQATIITKPRQRKCGNCGEPGHNSTKCTKPPKTTPNQNAEPQKTQKTTQRKCGACGEPGHNSTRCSKNPKTNTAKKPRKRNK